MYPEVSNGSSYRAEASPKDSSTGRHSAMSTASGGCFRFGSPLVIPSSCSSVHGWMGLEGVFRYPIHHLVAPLMAPIVDGGDTPTFEEA